MLFHHIRTGICLLDSSMVDAAVPESNTVERTGPDAAINHTSCEFFLLLKEKDLLVALCEKLLIRSEGFMPISR